MDLNSSTLSFKIRKQTHVLSMFLFPVGEQAEFCNPCNLIGFDSGGGGGGDFSLLPTNPGGIRCRTLGLDFLRKKEMLFTSLGQSVLDKTVPSILYSL